MSRVLMLVEGSTERAIVDRVFAPTLGLRGVYLYPRVVGKPGHKGGNRFSSVRRELKALIRQEPDSIVTMFFDYYGLGEDWPGLMQSKGKSPLIIPGLIEPAIASAVVSDLGPKFNTDRFIPYIQIYEVESLLFSGPKEMARVFSRPDLQEPFEKIVGDCGGCEWIDDSPETAPSKRVQSLFPQYKKGSGVNAHAYRIAQHIGLEKIRSACPHFNEWISKLENPE